jgi:predicted  nucleic acid-binding Zn-ribbon protein
VEELGDRCNWCTKKAVQQLTDLEQQRTVAEEKLSAIVAQASAARKIFDEAQVAALVVADEHTKANGVVSATRKKADAAAKKLSDANVALAKNVDIAQALTIAAEKAKLAVAKLPEEKELAAAAAIIAARADKLINDVAAAEKKANGLKPAAMSTAKTLEDAKKAATEVAARLATANQKLAATRPPVRKTIGQRVAEQSALAQLESRIALANELSKLGKQQAAADVAASSVAMMDAKLTSGRKELDQIKQGLPPLKALLADSKAKHDKATAELNQAMQETTGKQEAVKLITDVATAAEVASGKLPKDAELKKAAESLKSRSTALLAELSALQKQLVEQQKMATALAEKLAAVTIRHDAANKRLAELAKLVPSYQDKLPTLKTELQQAVSLVASSQEEMLDGWSDRFFSSPVIPLTPEQMAWSLMEVTGVVQKQRAAAVVEVDKTLPIDAKKPDDPVRLVAREVAIEKAVHAKLVANVKKFVELFGHAGGQPQTDFFATVDQALFFANAGTLQTWLNPGAGNLTDRLNKLENPAKIAEELYISVLTRRPTTEEVEDVTSYMKERPKEKLAAVKEMAWGLMTSTEFRFSY